MQTSRVLAWFAGGTALAAAALWLPQLAGVGSEPPPPATDARLAGALTRLDAIEARFAALAAAPAPAVAASLERVPAPPDTAALQRRIEELEQAFARANEGGTARESRAERTARHDAMAEALFGRNGMEGGLEAAAHAGQVEPEKQTILDPRATLESKVDAHERLRGVPNAYTDAMVQELVRIATTAADGQERADVWRFFDGATKPAAIVGPLLHAVANDPAAVAREEAAETLGNYRDQPGVEAALRRAAEHDADPKVRAKAERTLRGFLPHQAMQRR